jgi:hypothetical protein
MKKKYGRKLWLSIVALFALGSLQMAVGDIAPASQYKFETSPSVDSTGVTTATVLGSGLALDSSVPEGIGSTNSLSFGGSGSLDLRNAADPATGLLGTNIGYDTTIAFWMKADGTANINSAPVFTDHISGADYTILARRSGISDGLLIQLRGGAASTTIPAMFDNQWHHIAVVIDQKSSTDSDSSEGIKYYKDGVLFDSDTFSSWFILKKETLLGGDVPNPANYYNGLLDDVGIYTSKLSASEVAALAIPEPATFGLIGAFGAALVFVRRRFMI